MKIQNLKKRGESCPLETFWHQPARVVAPQLLGRFLCRRREDGRIMRCMITEVEAYCGPEDRASHASRGLTPRTRVMFGPPGFWYVYLCYGVHWMLNLVTGAEGYAAAVLLRGVEGMAGPGRLTKALGIDKTLDGAPCAKASGLWIEGRDPVPADWRRHRGPRIGVDYAGAHWAAKPYRWWLVKDPNAQRLTRGAKGLLLKTPAITRHISNL